MLSISHSRGIRVKSAAGQCSLLLALVSLVAVASCQTTGGPGMTAPPTTGALSSAPSAPKMSTLADALFYSKGGSLYVSAPAGTAGRRLTDGPFDSQPAPSPGLSRVAFVRKASPADYGGELWVVDLSPQLGAAGPPRRLVDPDTLTHGTGNLTPMVASPQWSPTGGHIAFVANTTGGAVDGGVLVVADTDNGAVVPSAQPPWAEAGFAWAPDGGHITWVNARSDVRPVQVNVLAIDGNSSPVAAGTNALSVTYAKNGQTILFTNGDSSPPAYTASPFELRTGGVYSVPAPTRVRIESPSPTALFTSAEATYTDIAVLESGAVGFTARRTQGSAIAIQILDKDSASPRTIVTDVTDKWQCHESSRGGGVCYPPQGPVWGTGDRVAYLSAAPQSPLFVTDLQNRGSRQVDTDVDSFAWAPATG